MWRPIFVGISVFTNRFLGRRFCAISSRHHLGIALIPRKPKPSHANAYTLISKMATNHNFFKFCTVVCFIPYDVAVNMKFQENNYTLGLSGNKNKGIQFIQNIIALNWTQRSRKRTAQNTPLVIFLFTFNLFLCEYRSRVPTALSRLQPEWPWHPQRVGSV